MADEGSHGNTPPSLKNFDNDSNMDREGSGDDSDTPPDLTCTHRHEGPPQDEVSQPASENDTESMPRSEDYNSNASAQRDLTWCGKTLEDFHLTDRHQPLHRHEESRQKESDVSAEAMEERHQQNSEDKEVPIPPSGNPRGVVGPELPGIASQHPPGFLSLRPMQLPYQSLVSTKDGVNSCRLCPYATKSKCIMTRHLRIHMGECPFQSRVCQRSSTLNSSQSTHTRPQAAERPFRCALCIASFSLKSGLIRHMCAMHPGERHFTCVHCRASFSHREQLIIHMSKCGANKKP